MTSDERPRARDPRFVMWIGGTAALFVVSVVVGFIWLPSAQPGAASLDLWGAICRAVGVPARSAWASVPDAAQPASTVAWTVTTREQLTRGNAARGATLAASCNNCHGERGISADAAIPNLAGQSEAAIYKQLEDFKSRRRNAAVMGVFVDPLSQQQMFDLATHYATLPGGVAQAANQPGSGDLAARQLSEVGSPMRSIASCASCHGPLGVTIGAPDLRGQQRAYFEEQLQAFKAARRHNDISEQMRNVARQLTDAEIANLAAYYASYPVATSR